jgi:Clp amino terminal domain, pathogenicity island component
MPPIPEVDELQAEVAPGAPLERLIAAGALAAKLRARSDELLDQFVAAARDTGASWSEIGNVLGTSKQAAQQRFAALAEPQPGAAPLGLRGPAGAVLDAAAEQARALGHHYVRPEHLVLGLVSQPEELAGLALSDLGVGASAARAVIITRLGAAPARPSGSLGVAPQTKRLLERSRTIARSLGHRCPRSEHVLLAAVSRKLHSPAAEVLAECGAEPDRVREHVFQLILEQAPELTDRLADLLKRRRAWP